MNRSAEHNNEHSLVCDLAPNSRIKLVGLGGIGCIVLSYLAIFLKSLGQPMRLVLIDGDQFEPGNAYRMAFDALGNKAQVKAAETLSTLGESDVTVVAVPQFIDEENLQRLIRPGDHVLLCVDNHATRRLVSEHCDTISDVVLISGGNDGVDPPGQRGTYGNVQIAIRGEGRELTVPITRYHPEIAGVTGKLPGQQECGEIIASKPQILFTNLAVASAMLNALFGYACGRLAYQEVQFDILEARMQPQFPLEPADFPRPLPSPQ